MSNLRVVSDNGQPPAQRWRLRWRHVLGAAIAAVGVWGYFDRTWGGWEDEITLVLFVGSAAYLFWLRYRERGRQWWIGIGAAGVGIVGLVVVLVLQIGATPQPQRGYIIVGLVFAALFIISALLRTAVPAATVVHIHKWEGKDDA